MKRSITYRFRLHILLVLFSMLSMQGLSAQEVYEPLRFMDLKKNALQFTPGFLAYTLSYERKLWHPKKPNAFFKTFTARFEGGPYRPVGYACCDDYYPLYILSASALTGRGSNHLEVSFGVLWSRHANNIFFATGDMDFSPGIGYRYQKTNGWFIFRAGASIPRFTYVSLGLAF